MSDLSLVNFLKWEGCNSRENQSRFIGLVGRVQHPPSARTSTRQSYAILYAKNRVRNRQSGFPRNPTLINVLASGYSLRPNLTYKLGCSFCECKVLM